MPHAGCRAIADCFNRRYAKPRAMTVGKTYVADTIRRHLYAIAMRRRAIKNAKPRRVPKNFVWAVDLTGKVTLDGKITFILGILEHASRAAVCLEALHSKSSAALIGKLIENIGRYGKPRHIRTDNESVLTSKSFRLALALLGIGHQRSDPGCPWQNGRVERFFGTLKDRLDQITVDSFDALCAALREFRAYYNHVRPHQNLGGATPAEAWAGVGPYTAKIRDEC